MYRIGDWIFYGNVGACQVTDLSVRKIAGMDKEHPYYTLKPFDNDCSISIPADNNKIFMRPLISKEEAEQLIADIPSIDAHAYYTTALRQLSEHYEDVLNTHDCHALIEMTMSIYKKRQEADANKKKLGAIDERYMKRAEDLLYGELAVALGIKKHEVQSYIADKLCMSA